MFLFDSGRTRGRRPGQHHGYSHSRLLTTCAGLWLTLVASAPLLRAQSGLLEARIVAGDGQVSYPGSSLPRPLVIEVTDETGARVDEAIVSFRVPDSGITGTFRNGLKTEILRTDGDGRASLRGLMAGGLAGQFQVHLTVAKGAARAGAISTQFIAPDSRARSRVLAGLPHSRRLLEIGGLVLAVAAAGYVRERVTQSGSAGSTAAPPTIGSPTITVGKP